MSITQDDVEHIASLARIALNAQEKKMFETELSGILAFVETSNELDTGNVEPVTGGTLLHNVMRDDERIDAYREEASAQLVEAAPDTKDGFIKVKSVFG